jgi:hypothetical protein
VLRVSSSEIPDSNWVVREISAEGQIFEMKCRLLLSIIRNSLYEFVNTKEHSIFRKL